MRIYQNVQKQLINLDQKQSSGSTSGSSNQKIDPKSTVLFGLNDLKEAIQIAASKSYLRTLLNSLRIFIPVNFKPNFFNYQRKKCTS
jgi:hypothetical protein